MAHSLASFIASYNEDDDDDEDDFDAYPPRASLPALYVPINPRYATLTSSRAANAQNSNASGFRTDPSDLLLFCAILPWLEYQQKTGKR